MSKHFKPIISKKNYVFNIVNLKLKKLTYELPPFKTFSHVFFCHRGSKTAGKCRYCTIFFVDSPDIGSKIDHYFKIQNSDLDFLTIKNFMC